MAADKNIYDEIGIPSVRNYKLMTQLMEPLKIHFGIDRFWRNHHRADGSYSVIGNYPSTAEIFFGQGLYKGNPYFRNPIFFKSGYMLPELMQNRDFEMTQGKLMDEGDCFHVFIKIKEHEDGFIEYGFATSKRQMGFEMTYINHLESINKFIEYFEAEAEKIIRESNEYRVDIPHLIGAKYDENPQLSGNILVPEKEINFRVLLQKNTEQTKALLNLTQNERNCLKLYLEGNTAKGIGKKLFRSPRTIESHLKNAKEKLLISSRNELVEFLTPFKDCL